MDDTTLAPSDARPVRRKPESLAKLKRAARKLFVERGYHATRPQDIAREAGLGHGTFYLHYPDKKACFLAFVDDAREELFKLRFQFQTGQLTDYSRLSEGRRSIARLMTVLRERELAEKLATAGQPATEGEKA